MKKFLSMLLAMSCLLCILTGCEESGSRKDTYQTLETVSSLQEKQPTPTDLDFSLERYNLIRRAYWVNGQREKAAAVVCQVEKPLVTSSCLPRAVVWLGDLSLTEKSPA